MHEDRLSLLPINPGRVPDEAAHLATRAAKRRTADRIPLRSRVGLTTRAKGPIGWHMIVGFFGCSPRLHAQGHGPIVPVAARLTTWRPRGDDRIAPSWRRVPLETETGDRLHGARLMRSTTTGP